MIVLDIICILAIIALYVIVIRAFIIQKKMDKQIKNMTENINSLHYNQNVLVSTLSKIYQALRTNERQTQKNKKVIRRQVRRGIDESETKGPDAV